MECLGVWSILIGGTPPCDVILTYVGCGQRTAGSVVADIATFNWKVKMEVITIYSMTTPWDSHAHTHTLSPKHKRSVSAHRGCGECAGYCCVNPGLQVLPRFSAGLLGTRIQWKLHARERVLHTGLPERWRQQYPCACVKPRGQYCRYGTYVGSVWRFAAATSFAEMNFASFVRTSSRGMTAIADRYHGELRWPQY